MTHEVDHRNIYDSNRVLTTAESFRKVSKDIAFPRNLRGKVVLDIGSGGSDTVAELRKRGANAFGVDIQFGNIPGLTTHLAQQLADPMAWVEGRNWTGITKDQAEQMLGLDQPQPPRFARWIIITIWVMLNKEWH
jgi:2-polyprenyl-3-methyl-5-hydroxy-6-metoxy-1,4-benzoquinol methylase